VLLDVTRASGVLERLLLRTVPFERIVDLAYEDDVRQRRARVEELSEGRLGYLHIRGMSTPSVRDFEHDLHAAAAGKDGLVIDVRDNGGGSTADILLASLTAPRHAWTLPRGADPDTTPRDAYPRDRRLIHGYSRPIVVLVNEYSFSNAEIFAHAIKTTGRGRLVGTATFGGVISTGGTTLVDGTRVRLPFRGWFLPDGTDMENHGAVPDLDVPRLPGDEAAGVDMQLERATSDLLSRLPQ
jgi:tricorn protease